MGQKTTKTTILVKLAYALFCSCILVYTETLEFQGISRLIDIMANHEIFGGEK